MEKIVSLVVLVLLSQNLKADDYIGQTKKIIVNIKGDQRSFSYCKTALNKKDEVCRDLGLSKWYGLKELEEISSSERTEAILKSVGSVVAVIGAWYVLIPAAATAGATTSASGVLLVGATPTVPFWFKKINPIRQFKQADILTNELINDEDISVDDEDIEEMAELLDEILD